MWETRPIIQILLEKLNHRVDKKHCPWNISSLWLKQPWTRRVLGYQMTFQNHLKRSQRCSRIHFCLKSLISSAHLKYIASSLNSSFLPRLQEGKKIQNTEYYTQLITCLIALFSNSLMNRAAFSFSRCSLKFQVQDRRQDSFETPVLRPDTFVGPAANTHNH